MRSSDTFRRARNLVREPFQRLIEKKALLAYKYTGFWQCMDTFKDKQHLEELNQGYGSLEGLESRSQTPSRTTRRSISAGV